MELKFDKTPAFIFIQHEAGTLNKAEIYHNGKKLRGFTKLKIEGNIEDFTTHEIEFVTGIDRRFDGK